MYKVVARSGRKETVWQPYASREEAEAKLAELRAEKLPGISAKAHWMVLEESAEDKLARILREVGFVQKASRRGLVRWVKEHKLGAGITFGTRSLSYDPYDADRIVRDIEKMGRDELLRRLDA